MLLGIYWGTYGVHIGGVLSGLLDIEELRFIKFRLVNMHNWLPVEMK